MHPIETAPEKGEFLAPDPDGDWLKVRRYDNPNPFMHMDNFVIHDKSGRWWSPLYWSPLPTIETEESQMSEKKDFWYVEVMAKLRHKVYFDSAVTKEEAMDKFENEEYEDIMDTEELESEVLNAE